MENKVDWAEAVKPLLKKYSGKRHPLEYKNIYQLFVMSILAMQDSDKHINEIAPKFFAAFPDLHSLAKADVEYLRPYVSTVRNFFNKSGWLVKNAQQIQDEKNFPFTMEELVKLTGIGRKSANLIMREAGVKAEGVLVDLHVIRVAERLGITKDTNPKVIEEDIMKVIPEKDWGEIGMALSFLGRDTCRPTNPMHDRCELKNVCAYYEKEKKK